MAVSRDLCAEEFLRESVGRQTLSDLILRFVSDCLFLTAGAHLKGARGGTRERTTHFSQPLILASATNG
jgi:hypothetical protein